MISSKERRTEIMRKAVRKAIRKSYKRARHITPHKKYTVYMRDKWTCQYCGISHCELRIDHIIPVIEGGGNELENLAVACKECDVAKGRMSLKKFLIILPFELMYR